MAGGQQRQQPRCLAHHNLLPGAAQLLLADLGFKLMFGEPHEADEHSPLPKPSRRPILWRLCWSSGACLTQLAPVRCYVVAPVEAKHVKTSGHTVPCLSEVGLQRGRPAPTNPVSCPADWPDHAQHTQRVCQDGLGGWPVPVHWQRVHICLHHCFVGAPLRGEEAALGEPHGSALHGLRWLAGCCSS